MKYRAPLVCLALSLCLTNAFAEDGAECRTVRFADIGWTDIAATTGLASTLLEGLGYRPIKTIASVPIAFAGLKSKQIDVFLGDWKPAMDETSAPFINSGAVTRLPEPNLTGAKFTLAVPAYEYDAGLKSFADLARFGDKVGYKIYGLGPGASGNALVQKMIDKNEFGTQDFKLVQSSEAGMLVEVNRAIRQHRWIVFLGWEPHPMNTQMDIKYLSGGDDVFGPNYGGAIVYTLTQAGYATRCPNAARLVSNLKFNLGMENQIMELIMTDKKEPDVAAKDWLKKNPAVLAQWLAGVKTFDGKDALPAVQSYLASH